MNEKKNKRGGVLVPVIVVLFVLALLAGGMYLWKVTFRSYSAVLMTTGDIYFGQLSYFPRLSLSDSYTLQVVADPGNSGSTLTQVVPLDLLVWSPSKIFLSRDQVVSISKIGEESQVMQLIRGQKTAQ